jgi:Fe-S cluster assembly iron-binding protein IscA
MMRNLYLFLLLTALFFGSQASAQVVFSPPCNQFPTGIYLENFDALPVMAGSFTNNVTIPGWYLNNPAIYRGGNDGSAGTSGFYAYNGSPAGEYALGFLASNSTPILRAGVRIRNNFGTPIHKIIMIFNGEQWRKGANGANTNFIAVEYQVKTGGVPANNVNDPGIWTPIIMEGEVTPVEFIAPDDSVNNFGNPVCGTGGRALQGNFPPNTVSIPSGNNQFFLNTPLMPGEEMMIRFSVEHQGCAAHGMAIDDLIIYPLIQPPAPTVFNGPRTVCSGGTANYSIDATDGVGYEWEFDPNTPSIDNPNSPNFTVDFTSVPPGDYFLNLRYYAVPQSSDPSCIVSYNSFAFATITVTNATPTPIMDSPNEQICYSPTHDVSAQPVDPSYTTEWTIVSGTPGSTITANPLAPHQATLSGIQGGNTYVLRFTVSGPGCPSASADMTLIVDPQPVIPNAGPDQSLCDVPNTTLTGNVTNGNGIANWSCFACPVNPTITLGGTSNEIANVSGMTFPGIYTFVYEMDYPNCDYFTDTVRVTVVPNIVANPNVQTSLCNATSTLLDGNDPAPGTGFWTIISQPSGGNASLVPPMNFQSVLTNMIPGTYVVQYTISNPPCPTVPLQITINNGPPLPIADAGLDQTLCATQTSTTVTGNAFPNGASGNWSFVSGPVTATITTAGTTGTVTGMTAPGEYVFRWTISGGSCTPETDDVSIFLVAPPTPANAGPDQTVCEGSNVTVTANAPIIGTGSWSIVSGPSLGPIINIPPNQGLISNPIPGTYTLRWTTSNPPCPNSVDDMILTVQQLPTVANAGPDQTLCNQSSITLTGNVPTVGTPTWTIVSGPGSPVLTPVGNVLTVSNMSIPGSYVFNYTISNGVCPPSQDNVTINIDAPSNGGTLNGPTAVCLPANPITLTLTGYTGNILRWESSTNNWATVTTISNTNPSFLISALSTTTSFRVVVQNGVCPQAFSSVRTVQVLPSPTPGTLKAEGGNFEGCSQSNFGTLSLTGFVGNIIRWESSTDNWATVNSIAHTAPTYSFTNLTAPTAFRVVVGNGACPNVYSNVVSINVRIGPSLSMSNIDIITGCNGRSTITAFATGGQPPYSYWINPANGSVAPYGNNGAIFSNVTSGTYTMYVRDANFCYSSLMFTLGTAPTPPSVRAIMNVTTNRATIYWNTIPPGINIRYNLRYSTNPNGPWTNVSNINATNWTLTNLLPNTQYYFQLQTNCVGGQLSAWSGNNTFTTLGPRQDALTDAVNSGTIQNLSLYPNPNNGAFTVRFFADESEPVTLEVMDVSGRIVYQSAWKAEAGENQMEVQLDQAAKGIYLLRMRNTSAIVLTTKVVVE